MQWLSCYPSGSMDFKKDHFKSSRKFNEVQLGLSKVNYQQQLKLLLEEGTYWS